VLDDLLAVGIPLVVVLDAHADVVDAAGDCLHGDR
jgi:hypothetical protein